MKENILARGEQDQRDLLTPDQVAAYLGINTTTLAVWRCSGRYKLPFVKVGRLVRYRKSTLDEFIASRTIGGVAA